MKSRVFYSSTLPKLRLAFFVLFMGFTSLLSAYFYTLEKVPLLAVILFFGFTATFLIRAVNLFRYPVVTFDGQKLSIQNWFFGRKSIEAFSDMEISGPLECLMIKQGKTFVSLPVRDIGKTQFNELLTSIAKLGDSPLTRLSSAGTSLRDAP